MLFLINQNNNIEPSVNLALEEYLLRSLDISHDYFLLYVNSPCVIIGRHQNVFEEVNYPLLRKQGIPVFRRISGGGTVYHDPGNLNFSFITRYQKFKFNNYRLFNAPILQALQSIGIPAEYNGRNDIVVNQKKISGNAQFTTHDRMVSHGTLLFSSRLNNIGTLLHSSTAGYKSRAIKSVRSPVVNISDLLDPAFNLEKFKELIIKYVFTNQPDIPEYRLSPGDWKNIHSLAGKKYQSWDWIFGESPDFSFQNTLKTPAGKLSLELEVKKCRLTQIRISGNLPDLIPEDITRMLLGVRYYPENILAALKDLKLNPDQENFIDKLFWGKQD